MALDDAEKELAELPGTFFASEAAAERLGMRVDETRRLLTEMETESRTLQVCRDGWVRTWRSQGNERTAPTLIAYLDDMMRHLGVGYYISYETAAQLRGVADRWATRNRVNVEADDDLIMDSLQLRPAYGPRDSVVRFHRIDPQHGRPVAILARMCWPTGDDSCTARPERRQVRVATADTALLDMLESPERSGGLPGIAAIARRMLWEHSLHPKLLAEAAARYEPHVAMRAGSLLQQLRGYRRWINLRPLMRHVRSTGVRYPVALRDDIIGCRGRADRWGVIYPQRNGPTYRLLNSLPWLRPGRQAAPPWLQRLMMRRVPRWRRAIRRPDQCRLLASPISDRETRIRTTPDAGFGETAHG